MIKYSVILPFYEDRLEQFRISLASYVFQTVKKFELVIIDQGSKEKLEKELKKYNFPYTYIKVDLEKAGYSKECQNPTYAQNIGVLCSSGQYIILTSPEVVPENQFFEKCDNLDIDSFIFFRCGFAKKETVDLNKQFSYDYLDSINIKYMCNKQIFDVDDHPYYLSVIPKSLYMDQKGTDEIFMYSIGFDDIDFGRRLKVINKRKYIDSIMGVHLCHDNSYQHNKERYYFGKNLIHYRILSKYYNRPIQRSYLKWGSFGLANKKGIIKVCKNNGEII